MLGWIVCWFVCLGYCDKAYQANSKKADVHEVVSGLGFFLSTGVIMGKALWG